MSPTIGVDRLALAMLLAMKCAYEDRGEKDALRRDQVPATPPEEVQGKKRFQKDKEGGPSKTQRKQKKKRNQGQEGQGHRQQRQRQHHLQEFGCQDGSEELLSLDMASQEFSEEVIFEEEEDDAGSTLQFYSFSELGVTGAVAGHGRFGRVLQVRL